MVARDVFSDRDRSSLPWVQFVEHWGRPLPAVPTIVHWHRVNFSASPKIFSVLYIDLQRKLATGSSLYVEDTCAAMCLHATHMDVMCSSLTEEVRYSRCGNRTCIGKGRSLETWQASELPFQGELKHFHPFLRPLHWNHRRVRRDQQ